MQIWLNLPKAKKMSDPHFKMLWDEDIPRVKAEGVEVSVIAGSYPGSAAALAPPPDSYASDPRAALCLLTLTMAAGADYALPGWKADGLGAPPRRSLFVYAGSMTVDGRRMASPTKVSVRADATLQLTAGGDGCKFVVMQARPIGEPVVQHGPFVGCTRGDIVKAFEDYQTTEFGGWSFGDSSPNHPAEKARHARYADGRVEEPGKCEA